VQRFASFAAVLALATSATLLSGCPSRPKYPECNNDDDCKEQKQVCVDKQCKECRDNSQCKEGFVCKNNACQPKPQCAETKDCPQGQKCTADGKCIPECAPETAAKDCGEGKKCLAGRCAGPDACNADSDCDGGKACQNGTCAVKSISCKSDDDCPADAACVNSVCQTGATRKVKCPIEPIHFAYDKSNIDAKAKETIAHNVKCLDEMGVKAVKVEGHTDERGTTEYNIALGSRRANAVKKVLQHSARGISVETESFGKERPVDPGHSEEAFAKNRRAEIIPEK
jgi:peptidoglycan-associated lipoprotein